MSQIPRILHQPLKMSGVRNLHDLTSFYRRFVKNFNSLTAPLNEVVKKMWVGEKQNTH